MVFGCPSSVNEIKIVRLKKRKGTADGSYEIMKLAVSAALMRDTMCLYSGVTLVNKKREI